MRLSKYGLIGFPLGHSFSKSYYTEKFGREDIRDVDYNLYPLEKIEDFPALVAGDPLLFGVNVTIPHKIAIMQFLDELSPEAREIGAVNCIRIERKLDGKVWMKGYNTDVFGFEKSLQPLLRTWHRQALVLGNGGAAKAVCYALDRLEIVWKIVSRRPSPGDRTQLSYASLDQQIMASHKLVINTTPLGTFPEVEQAADIPYNYLDAQHLLYDLVYNPAKTAFLKKGEEQGAAICNGYEMLVFQAERNWEIWRNPPADILPESDIFPEY